MATSVYLAVWFFKCFQINFCDRKQYEIKGKGIQNHQKWFCHPDDRSIPREELAVFPCRVDLYSEGA